MQSKFSIPCLAPLATALIGIAGSTQAIAENHALIMTVDYRGTSAALPGIDKDANLAKKIAKSLGPVRDEAVFDKSIFDKMLDIQGRTYP